MKNALLILTTFVSISVFGQNDFILRERQQIECSNAAKKNSLHFVEFMRENSIKSAKIILNQWEATCGLNEPVFRAKILWALKTGQFNDAFFSKNCIEHIFNYQSRMKGINLSGTYWYDSRKAYYGNVPPGQDFDNYTRELAAELLNTYPRESMEYILAEFYSNNCDTIFQKLQTFANQESTLVKEYKAEVKKYKRKPEIHIAAITGIWVPTGKLSILGVHPDIGFEMGIKKGVINFDLMMTVKGLRSPNNYYARRKPPYGELELTNFFFGGYCGFDMGCDIFVKKGHEIQLIGGIAFELLFPFIDQATRSHNFNFGLGYRYYIRNGFYVGMKARYNIVDYTLDKVLDFTGNTVTVHFMIGGVNNRHRNEGLEALRYPLRK